jgi:flagellar FliL protein
MSEAKANVEDGELKKPSKKKLIIIIVAVLVLLAGGGGAAFYFLKVAPAKEEHGAKKDGKAEHGAKKGAEAKDEHGDAKEEDSEHADAEDHGDKAEHDAAEGGHEGDAEHGEHAEHDGVRLEMIYYDMGKPFVVSLPQGSSAKLVSVSVSVSAEDQEAVDALKKHEPMIRNNLMMLIGSQKVDDLKTREGKEQLRKEILHSIVDILKKKLGKAHVEEVFFTSFVLQ